MGRVIEILSLGCLLASLAFVVRFFCAPFSSTIREQVNRHRRLHLIWGALAVTTAFILFPVLNPAAWPPRWWEREGQRKQVRGRVQVAGGWEALRRDCVLLVRTNESLYWSRWFTNDRPVLPPALAALKPQQVEYVSPRLLGEAEGQSRTHVVRIKIFGMHSTGGHSTPYFGLEVVTDASAGSYVPKRAPAVPGNGHLKHRRVFEGVYEIF